MICMFAESKNKLPLQPMQQRDEPMEKHYVHILIDL